MDTKLSKSQLTNIRRKSRTEEQILEDQARLRPNGTKRCANVHGDVPLSEFSRNIYQADGLSALCRKCDNMRRRGIETPPYVSKQCGAYCTVSEGCGRNLHIMDFDFKDGKFSILCSDCNTRIRKEKEAEARKVKTERREFKKNNRKCKSCQEWKLRSEFPTRGSVLSQTCIDCTPAPTVKINKLCNGCHQEFPLSEFTKDKNSSDGRGGKCTDCRRKVNQSTAQRRASRTEPEILADQKRLRPTGKKVCRKCDKEFVLEEFGRNKYLADGCGQWCKKCLREKNGKYNYTNSQRSDDEIRAKRDELRPDGIKNCRRCRKDKEFEEYFTAKRNPDGLSQLCRKCTAKDIAGRDGTLFELVEKYGPECLFPGCTSTDLTIDHVLPLSMGGKSDMDNYQQLCHSHNSRKHATFVDYRP